VVLPTSWKKNFLKSISRKMMCRLGVGKSAGNLSQIRRKSAGVSAEGF
jgi:hypothetical protein